MFGDLQPGQQVRAVREVTNGLGTTVVRRGERGIVREARPGLFQRSYIVEFADGLLTRAVRVNAADVRRRTFDGGEARWAAARDWQVGVRIGLFLVFGLPAALALGRYFVFQGGTVEELVAALPMALLEVAVDLVVLLGPLGAGVLGLFVYLRARKAL